MQKLKPEDHWSCIAHLSAKDMFKSVVVEEKTFKIIDLVVLRLNVPVNNFSVMSGRSHRFLGN